MLAPLTYATVCSGVEGCSLALDGMGWQPIFFSEIEPFPCADAPRYKSCGNGWAINSARWVLQGIDKFLRK